MTAAARSDDESGTAHLGRVHQDASERWSVTADVMAQALGGRRAGSAWMARCPAHDDHVPSLAIDERSDGTVLVCGHAGCSQHAVINALTARGLWPGVSGRSLAQVPVPPRQRTDREPPPSRTRVGAAMSIWHRSEPAAGTLVETYLRTRGITRPPPKVLNHHASNAVKNGEDVAVHPTTAVQPPAACRDVPANGGIHIDCDQQVGRTCTRMITRSTGLDHQAQPCVRMVRAVRTGAGVGGVRDMWPLDTADGSAS